MNVHVKRTLIYVRKIATICAIANYFQENAREMMNNMIVYVLKRKRYGILNYANRIRKIVHVYVNKIQIVENKGMVMNVCVKRTLIYVRKIVIMYAVANHLRKNAREMMVIMIVYVVYHIS